MTGTANKRNTSYKQVSTDLLRERKKAALLRLSCYLYKTRFNQRAFVLTFLPA